MNISKVTFETLAIISIIPTGMKATFTGREGPGQHAPLPRGGPIGDEEFPLVVSMRVGHHKRVVTSCST